MGFHGGAEGVYICNNCHIYLTSHDEMTNPNFTGSTGPAMLFRHVWNIRLSILKERKMTTGWHIVRDAHCIRCDSRLGWMYEIAMEVSQEYKEGQIILENALIIQSQSDEDPLGADSMEQKCIEKKPVYERPLTIARNTVRINRSSRSRESTSISSSSSSTLSSNSSKG